VIMRLRQLMGTSRRPPVGDSLRPSAESDRDTLNRCVVFQGTARDGASIDGALRDANGRRWPVGPAPTPPSRLLSVSLRLAKERGSNTTLDDEFGRDLEPVVSSHREPLTPPA
jgi:hypothetical protein